MLDARTHIALLDRFGDCAAAAQACLQSWSLWRQAREHAAALRQDRDRVAALAEELSLGLAELDRLSPATGEASRLVAERALLGATEKTLADIAAAREGLEGDVVQARLGQAYRAVDRARQRVLAAGVDAASSLAASLTSAADALDRAMIEASEATERIDAAAASLEFEPGRLNEVEERLFALRAIARKLGVEPDDLEATRAEMATRLLGLRDIDDSVAAADAAAARAAADYWAAALALRAQRQASGDRLARAVMDELAPLKLDRARFRVSVDPLPEDRAGPSGADRVEFQVTTLPGAPFQGLGAIASGGELARFALALKACLAAEGGGDQPLMIFDEVDQGVGGAVADAVGARLKALALKGQVLVVTHSPQVAARGHAHWRVRKVGDGAVVNAVVDALTAEAREEEIARMLSGAAVTDAARAAARALMHA